MELRVVLRGVDRALGIDADDLHLGLPLVEPAADAGDGSAGADGDDDRVERAAGLLPDLRRRHVVVRLRVRHVRVLVRLEAAGDLLGEARRDRVVALRRVVVDRRRRDHDLGAVRAQHRDLLLAHLVRHDEDAGGSPCAPRRWRGRRRCCPEVGSTIVPPGFSFPSRSAASIIARPIRSLTEPPGLRNSSFARMRAPPAGDMRSSRTIGVPPTRSRIVGKSRAIGGKPTARAVVAGRHEDHSDRQGERRRRARPALASRRATTCTAFGRDGGDAADADVLVVAVPSGSIADALGEGERHRGQGHDRRDERVPRPQRGVRVACTRGEVDRRRTDGEVVQPQLRQRLRRDREQRVRPCNLYAADDDARDVTEQLIRDAGYDPVYASAASTRRGLLEDQLGLLFARQQGAGLGPFFYRYREAGRAVARPALRLLDRGSAASASTAASDRPDEQERGQDRGGAEPASTQKASAKPLV